MKKLLVMSLVVLATVFAVAITRQSANASDHDDGETDLKGRALNLTDLFVFREGDQTGTSADNSNLIFIMNSNPRSVPQQQYFFSTTARYEFHITRVSTANKAVTPTGADDITLRFEFGASDSNIQQAMTVTSIVSGATTKATTTTAGGAILTTKLGAAVVNNTVALGSTNLTVFAGLREDPFFFDVETYFKVRSSLASSSGANVGSGFKAVTAAQDFTKDYNVNSIVVRVPITFLQAASTDTVFDVWETISVPN